jgi:hypothetical protein
MVVLSRRASLGTARLFLGLAGDAVEGAELPTNDPWVVSLFCETGDVATRFTGFARSPSMVVELLDALFESLGPSLEERFRGTSPALTSQPEEECPDRGNFTELVEC